MITWLLSFFSTNTLSKALRKRKDVANLSIFSSDEIERYHRAIQTEILELGVEMFEGIKTRHVFEKDEQLELH